MGGLVHFLDELLVLPRKAWISDCVRSISMPVIFGASTKPLAFSTKNKMALPIDCLKCVFSDFIDSTSFTVPSKILIDLRYTSHLLLPVALLRVKSLSFVRQRHLTSFRVFLMIVTLTGRSSSTTILPVVHILPVVDGLV